MDQQSRRALGRLAASQRGLFSAAQAARLGISLSQLSRAAEHGLVRRVRRGVYAICGTPPSRWEAILAAALGAGPAAVISHSSAAAVHRLYMAPAGVPEITISLSLRCRLPGVVVHRSSPLPLADLTARYGVNVTSPERTIVDMAGRVPPTFLERMVDEGLVDGRLSVARLASCLERAVPNKPGRSALERLMSLRNELPAADSVLELRVYRALRALAPYRPHFRVTIGKATFVLDAAWPEHRVAAEIVGRRHRVASRSAFDRERRKLNALMAARWQIAHLTAAMRDDEMLAAVGALLRGG
ncbi:MAG: type IV toxin-antitoxin system AbiEi family antitoxin domain-containing protein [Acidimicrobiales bacterium]